MVEILYSPDRERIVTSNVWAFLHWLRTTRGVDLQNWTALQRWSGAYPAGFAAAIATFVGLSDEAMHLMRHGGLREALVCRRADGSGWTRTRDELRICCSRNARDATSALSRTWSVGQLIRPLADVLLHADVRPDDRLLVIGPKWPWLAALLEGTIIVLSAAHDALTSAADEGASVLVAPANILAEAAFPRRGARPDLAGLRTIVVTGGPLSPEARRRVYTWIKPDVMLLARAGDTYWGNPLEPVLALPCATPAFVTPPASAPALY